MRLIKTVSEMQHAADALRREGKRVGLVPTMGALHEGHAQLVRVARRSADEIIVSIFVNPTQFAPGEDFERYPRPFESDLDQLRALDAVRIVFAPEASEIYPSGNRTRVVVSGLTEHLCGKFRPGHFDGVTTIVTKLFNACRPDVAVFGLKDAQQFLVLKAMVKDLDMGVEMVGVETVREPDGLARSSRNAFLTPEERSQAAVIFRALQAGTGLIGDGESRADRVIGRMSEIIAGAPLARIQYIEIVRQADLQPVTTIEPGSELLIATAVFFGKTRLIDNQFVFAP